ncbi:MAG TPA: polyprenyl synthetase family protein [Polyangiaceae bacterium]|nr:polyprenyl synthetase family protein [Polyangiaceae bacterium]
MTASTLRRDEGRLSANRIDGSAEVFSSLVKVCAGHGLGSIEERLNELRTWMNSDLEEIELAIGEVGSGGETIAHKSARHLLDLSGKRLRPLCVALSARAGEGFTPAARRLAVAVELVHNATLLHDDVVDMGDRRRGADAARVIYGNAASIFGGDWLLAEALCRIQEAAVPGVLERMLDVIKEMVLAEAVQLAQRGQIRASADDYFRIISGKTASLFRWATFAGAKAGGAEEAACAALEGFGQKLGVAFQLVDDVLDFTGAPEAMGKSLLADLREGKMTYPLILVLERDRDLFPVLQEVCEGGEAGPSVEVGRKVVHAMAKAGVVEDCIALATRFCDEAVASLAPLPEGPAKAALAVIAAEAPRRRR